MLGSLVRLFIFLLVMQLIYPNPKSSFYKAEAAELRSTNNKHYLRGPNRGQAGMFGGQGKKFRTRIIQAPKRGVIAVDTKPLFQAAAFDGEASRACREGRLRRFGGGVAEFGGRRYPAATRSDMSRNLGLELQEGIYVFVSEGSTGCQVYLFQQIHTFDFLFQHQ